MKAKRFSISLSALSAVSVAAAAFTAAAVCIIIFISVYNNALLHEARVNSEQATAQAELAVSNYFHSVTNELARINRIISAASSSSEAEEKLSAFTYIQNDIYAITVYDKNGGIISCTGSGGKRKKQIIRDLSFDSALMDSSAPYSVSSPHVQTLFENEYPWVVTVAAALDKPVLGSGYYLAIDYRFSEIAGYIDNIGIGRHGYCFIMDGSGEIIYHPQQQMIFSGLKSENTDYLLSLPDGITNAKDKIYALKTTDLNSWRIVGISYTNEFTAERNRQIFISIALSLLFCILIMLSVLFIYSKRVNKPLKALIGAMKSLETDAADFNFSEKTASVKEIKVLSSSFKHMSEKIKELMAQIRAEEKVLRKTELKALQAQINPHFLYNTLDSIQWMCEQGKAEDASKMVSALARLFRISISRGKELIPIKDEFLHAKNYLIIQSFRYKNQFTYTFDTEPGLEKYLCNKITVQPLIENAIYHGIDRLVDEGEIKVSVKTAPDDAGDILITVADNGVGMTEEQCRAVLKKEKSDSSGIGIKNVNDRLKIYFGEKYGISIKSELDEGTAVTVRIPKIEKEPEREDKNEE